MAYLGIRHILVESVFTNYVWMTVNTVNIGYNGQGFFRFRILDTFSDPGGQMSIKYCHLYRISHIYWRRVPGMSNPIYPRFTVFVDNIPSQGWQELSHYQNSRVLSYCGENGLCLKCLIQSSNHFIDFASSISGSILSTVMSTFWSSHRYWIVTHFDWFQGCNQWRVQGVHTPVVFIAGAVFWNGVSFNNTSETPKQFEPYLTLLFTMNYYPSKLLAAFVGS